MFYKKLLLFFATAFILGGGIVAASDYPNRTITHIFPWDQGSKTYGVAQFIANGMSKQLGVKMAVVAKPGAGGVKAAQAVLAAKPDGYTTFDGYIAPMVIAQMFNQVGYKYSDFKPLQSGVYNPFAIAIRSDDDRWDTLEDLLTDIKANPKKYRYNGGPQVALPHMIGAKLLQTSNAIARYIPLPSQAEGAVQLRNGIVDFMVISPAVYRANKQHVKILSVLTNLPKAKQIYHGAPLITEQGIDLGLRDLGSVGWDWWAVHKDTPDDIVNVLRNAMAKAKKDPEVIANVEGAGFVLLPYEYERFDEIMSSARDQIQSAADAIDWENAHFK